MHSGQPSRTVALSLGSNQGASRDTLSSALQELRALDRSVAPLCSSLYLTEPWGKSDQPPFLNLAVVMQNGLPGLELLSVLQSIELRHGRVRHERWGPRTLDIDLLLCGDEIIAEPNLEVPHPRMHLRGFVLLPLAEIAPNVVHPILHQTMSDLAQRSTDVTSVTKVGVL